MFDKQVTCQSLAWHSECRIDGGFPCIPGIKIEGLPVDRLLSKSKNIAKEVDQPGSPASESPICRNDETTSRLLVEIPKYLKVGRCDVCLVVASGRCARGMAE